PAKGIIAIADEIKTTDEPNSITLTAIEIGTNTNKIEMIIFVFSISINQGFSQLKSAKINGYIWACTCHMERPILYGLTDSIFMANSSQIIFLIRDFYQSLSLL
ncbi:MAG: hypothetical protein O4860_07970, partial [Trichodesmium sp. St2_bin2_1]|nr:hypothetical protein [Trichodesmium sp. St2_bin2_1]